MTGEKNRYKTHEKLWDLDDKSLKTPKHDEMILYLLNNENLEKLGLLKKIDKKGIWLKNDEEIDKNEVPLEFIKKVESLKYDTNIKSEVPLKADNGFIIGYADLIIKQTILKIANAYYDGKTNSLKFYQYHPEGKYEEEWDHTNKYDKYAFKFENQLNINIYSLIEVKPYIDSFGAVLRQLNTYKSNVHGLRKRYDIMDFYLFTIDDRFKEAFESQGIQVLLPPKTKKEDSA